MFHVKPSSCRRGTASRSQLLPDLLLQCRMSLIFLAFLLSAAGCGTTPSGRETPLPSAPGGLLEVTRAPIPLATEGGSVDIKVVLENLQANMTLLGECRGREQEFQSWLKRAGISVTTP